MSAPPSPPALPDGTTPPGEQPALLDAVRALLVPLAELAVARGLSYPRVEEMLREAFVGVAHAAHPNLAEHRRVSRISATTGINRREVTRLTAASQRRAAPARSYPSELFARWTTDPACLDATGRPRPLPRLGPAPSFEALAQSLTRDMHPRSLLEELLRLGLARHDTADDRVTLSQESFVPRSDRARMDGFLGANVGDHLSAAVANVLAGGSRHFEQAMFADGLSEASLAALHDKVGAHWRQLTADLVPQLEKMIEADEKAGVGTGARAGHRVRIGLYSFDAPVAEAAGTPAAAPAPAPTAAAEDTASRPRKNTVARGARRTAGDKP